MTKITEDEIKKWEDKIKVMSHQEMAKLFRFAPSGHPCFVDSLPLNARFMKRFIELGGMTSKVSKEIG